MTHIKNTFQSIVSSTSRHKTSAIPGTVSSVPNYPKKLKIYLNNASPYWQASYYDNGTTYRHSLKTQNKKEAYERAKLFYEMLIFKKYQHPAHIKNHEFLMTFEKHENEKSGLTFNDVYKDWLDRKTLAWTPRHTIEVKRRLANDVLPFIGGKNIEQIATRDLLTLIQKIEKRGAYDRARRALNDCNQIFQYAMASGICHRNVTQGLGVVLHSHSVIHQKAVPIEDLPKLIADIKKYKKPDEENVRLCLLILSMTFVRKSELLYAKWFEFDLKKKIWKIPAERMKMRIVHTVPLSSQVCDLLVELKRKYPSDDYLFYDQDSTKPIRDNALIEALYWLGYKGKMTVHGFRAVASTILNENGFRSDVIERQLAHIDSNEVRRAYNRAEYLDERLTMMQWWSDYLGKLVE
jgi:integrase